MYALETETNEEVHAFQENGWFLETAVCKVGGVGFIVLTN